MSCLMKFKWVKLPRENIPDKKGIMGYWMKLATRVAFRKGSSFYCGHTNEVSPGEWVGGVMGLKSVLGVKSKDMVFEILEKLSNLEYITYKFDTETRRLSYMVRDWVIECSGKECEDDNVYATNDFGFLCVPRDITERLVESGYKFEESDAWLDLWTHTIFEDKKNFLTFFAPMVRFRDLKPFFTLEGLSRRWGWEKTKTWRFFQKNKEVFELYRLPGTYGCLIVNKLYPISKCVKFPTQKEIVSLIYQAREALIERNVDCSHGNLGFLIETLDEGFIADIVKGKDKNSVALFHYIIRAYISPCWNNDKEGYDCKGDYTFYKVVIEQIKIRGPCVPLELRKKEKYMKKYSDQEFSKESRQMLKLLISGGMIKDNNIKEEKVREFRQKKLKYAYHNTKLLLKNYRNIVWLVECFPDFIAAELDEPLENVDQIIARLDVEMAYGNRKIENRMDSIQKTRLVIDRINEALSTVKRNPNDGQRMYDLLYLTYISEEKLSINEIIYRMSMSSKQYYRIRDKAIDFLSTRLWGSPQKDMNFWMEMLVIFDNKEK